jgi:hypothetical protein
MLDDEINVCNSSKFPKAHNESGHEWVQICLKFANQHPALNLGQRCKQEKHSVIIKACCVSFFMYEDGVEDAEVVVDCLSVVVVA